VPGTGFILNGCMSIFDPRPGKAMSIAPGKSYTSSMAPAMLFDDEGPQIVIGAPGAAYIPPGDYPMSILVIGGSQGARILSDVIPDAIGKLSDGLKKRIHITQQCRPEDLEEVRGAYKRLGIDAELESFFDDVPDRLAAAHLVISRSGASTVAELLTVGRPALLVPYKYAIDDHQSLNAHAVDEVGAGWLIPEADFTADSLASRLESMFGMPMILEKAAEAARKAGRPDATERLATLVEATLSGDTGTDERAAA